MSRRYCFTSGVVFVLVALIHAWRFALDVPVQIGAWNMSRGLSAVAAVGAALLAGWAFKSAAVGDTRTIVYS
jgi:hypothetical protein